MNVRRVSMTIVALAALTTMWPSLALAKLKVVTTTTDLKSVCESIGGDKVEVKSIGTGREDPHFIDAKPSCMLIAHDADLWIRIGLELEIGYERLILDGSRNPKIRIGTPGHLDASRGVLRLEVPSGKVDRSMGDIHPEGNPHYWLDPLNMRIVAKSIGARLAKLDPANAKYFAEHLKAFLKQLDTAMFGPKLMEKASGPKLWAMLLRGKIEGFVKSHGGDDVIGGWWGKMRPLRGTKVVTYHRSWSYFANRFGLNVVSELEPKPGIEPTPSHLSEVEKIVKSDNVRFLLMEPFYSRKAPDWLRAQTGIEIVVAANSTGGQPEAKDYLSMMDNVVNRCVAAFGKSPAAPH